MSRTLTVVIGAISLVAMQHIPAPDSITSFAIGGFVGMVLGAVLGVAFVYNEREEPKC